MFEVFVLLCCFYTAVRLGKGIAWLIARHVLGYSAKTLHGL